MQIKITNICARFSTNCSLNLNELYLCPHFVQFSSKTYDQSKFSALICKICNTSLTYLIFKTGVVVITGGKSKSVIKQSVNDFIIGLIMFLNLKAKAKKFRITNMCFSTRFQHKIDLIKFAKQDKSLIYEIEIFANAKYRQNEHTFTITHNGSIFGTGFKKIREIKREIKILTEKLQLYIKN